MDEKNYTMGKRKQEQLGATEKRPKLPSDELPHENEPTEDHSDEMSEELDESDDNNEGDETKPEKRKTNRPTLSANDVQVARETAELFKSNIFKLQIDELLKETRIKESHIARIEKVLHRLHEMISQVPASGPLTLDEANATILKKVAIPFPDPKPTKLSYNLEYRTPSDVSIVGSFGLKTGTAGASTIDVALTMPEDLLHAKDYLNYRALYKRSFYIAYLADQLIPLLKKHHLPVKIAYHYLNGDTLCPVLRITSINSNDDADLTFDRTHFAINILVGFPHGVFDLRKLLPDKNCIRIEHDGAELPPTPLYNASVLSMTAYDYYLKYLYTTKKQTAAFKEACILARFWLGNHGFGSGVGEGGFGHFEMAILMAALLQGGSTERNSSARMLLHGFSSYQLFKGAVAYLATVDLSSGYLAFSSLVGETTTARYLAEGWGVPTLFDRNIRLNILWKMTEGSYVHLVRIARRTLAMLGDSTRDRFDAVLLQQVRVPILQYDVVFEFEVPHHVELDTFGAHEKITYLTFENYCTSRVHAILSKALGRRAVHVGVRAKNILRDFSLVKRRPAPSALVLVVGLILDSSELEKLVTKGPPEGADDTVSTKDIFSSPALFRSFWGKRALLRRFKDGVIQHCVVWESQREPLVVTISKEALDIHFSAHTSEHLVYESALEKLPVAVTNSGQGVTLTANVMKLRAAFDAMSKMFGALELPLGIRAVSVGRAPAIRGTSVVAPVPFAVGAPDFWNDVVVQFESSARWPDEISALENAKTAFLLKMQREMPYSSYVARDDAIPFGHGHVLHVLSPEGFGFRVRVLTEKDEEMYLRAVGAAGKEKAFVQEVYLRFAQTYAGAVKHSRSVQQLGTHYAFFSGTVRLFKAWLDLQLLLCHMSDEIVELLALKVFVDSGASEVPHSIENGFAQILNFLARWNWKEDPLILDLVREDAETADRLSLANLRVIEANFAKIRQQDPSGIKTQLFVGTKDDPSGILWSHGMSLPIATRLTALSRIASGLVKTQGLTHATMDVLFAPSLNDYDFVIEMKPQNLTTGILPRNAFKNLAAPPSAYPADMAALQDLVREFFRDLERKLGNVLIFSTHRLADKNVITGLFIPTAMATKKFRANLNINVKPVGGDEVVVNKAAVMEQIRLLGGDLIENVKEKGKKEDRKEE